MALAVVGLAATVRFAGLDRPGDIYFDEASYAQDACVYVLPAEECGFESGASESSEEHPPLGKWLIGAGIEVVGFEPAGWRLLPALAGTATVGVMFLLARRLLGSVWAATTAAVLLALDPLHVVLSRIAMLDVFVALFTLCAIALAAKDASEPEPSAPAPAARTILQPWRLAAGAAVGAAVACKWSGIFVLPVVVAMLLHARGATWSDRATWARRHAASLIVALALVPATVYLASYAGRFDAQLLAAPWDASSWLRTFLGRQQDMLEFHLDFDGAHPYASPAWSWPLIKRPVVFFFESSAGRVREVLAVGSPALWWPALVAWLVVLARVIRSRRATTTELVVLIGVALLYGPWLVLTLQRSFAFLFYLLPALPILYLGLVAVVCRLARPWRPLIHGGLVVAAAVSLAFFWPVLTARELDTDAWDRRMVFGNCRADPLDDRLELAPDEQPTPLKGPGRPPAGWCWI